MKAKEARSIVQLKVEIDDCEFNIGTKKHHAIKEDVCFTGPRKIVRNKDLNIDLNIENWTQ